MHALGRHSRLRDHSGVPGREVLPLRALLPAEGQAPARGRLEGASWSSAGRVCRAPQGRRSREQPASEPAAHVEERSRRAPSSAQGHAASASSCARARGALARLNRGSRLASSAVPRPMSWRDSQARAHALPAVSWLVPRATGAVAILLEPMQVCRSTRIKGGRRNAPLPSVPCAFSGQPLLAERVLLSSLRSRDAGP